MKVEEPPVIWLNEGKACSSVIHSCGDFGSRVEVRVEEGPTEKVKNTKTSKALTNRV